jgi:cytoskeletal protein CcmA (bactofilin family)
MGLFGNSSENDTSTMANQANAVQDQINLVGEGTVFEGTVRADSDVRTSGRIVGTLEVEGKAMISESGSVDGEIIATNADIAGAVQGEIHVEERLMLKSSARVEGTIEAGRLVVEEGAQFSGECEMGRPISVNGEAEEERASVSMGTDETEGVPEDVGVDGAEDGE